MGNQVFFSHFDEKFDYIIAKFTSKAKQLQRFGDFEQFCLLIEARKYSVSSGLSFGNWKPIINDEKCFLFHLEIWWRTYSEILF